MTTGTETSTCPCNHRWLAHALGALSGKPGYGPCFVEGCGCVGQDQAEHEEERGLRAELDDMAAERQRKLEQVHRWFAAERGENLP